MSMYIAFAIVALTYFILGFIRLYKDEVKSTGWLLLTIGVLYTAISIDTATIDNLKTERDNIVKTANKTINSLNSFKAEYNYVETRWVDEDVFQLSFDGASTFISLDKMDENNATMASVVRDFVKTVKEGKK